MSFLDFLLGGSLIWKSLNRTSGDFTPEVDCPGSLSSSSDYRGNASGFHLGPDVFGRFALSSEEFNEVEDDKGCFAGFFLPVFFFVCFACHLDQSHCPNPLDFFDVLKI